MKFSVEQNELTSAISTAIKGVSGKNTIELLKGILFETYEDRLILTSNNLEIGIQTSINATIEEHGKVVIDARIISDIVKKLPASYLDIKVDDSNVVSISSGLARFNIKGFDAEDFPMPVTIEDEDYKDIPADIFREMIRKTSFAVSSDETKPLLMGELIEFKEDGINIVAIDGFRLAIKKSFGDFAANYSKIVVPGKTLQEVSRMIGSDTDVIKLGYDAKHAVFIMGDTIFTTRLLAGEFLNYNEILPKEFSTKVTVRVSDFLDSLERSAVVSKNNLVKLEIKDDYIRLTAKNDEIGNLEENIAIDLEGNDLEIAFNSRYFIECIKNIDEESITLEFNTNVSPCILRPVGDDSYTYLLLPVRI